MVCTQETLNDATGNSIEGWKIYSFDGEYWYVARSQTEVLEAMHADTGESLQDDCEMREITSSELDNNTFYKDGDDRKSGVSFRVQLAAIVADGSVQPGEFATTDY